MRRRNVDKKWKSLTLKRLKPTDPREEPFVPHQTLTNSASGTLITSFPSATPLWSSFLFSKFSCEFNFTQKPNSYERCGFNGTEVQVEHRWCSCGGKKKSCDPFLRAAEWSNLRAAASGQAVPDRQNQGPLLCAAPDFTWKLFTEWENNLITCIQNMAMPATMRERPLMNAAASFHSLCQPCSVRRVNFSRRIMMKTTALLDQVELRGREHDAKTNEKTNGTLQCRAHAR